MLLDSIPIIPIHQLIKKTPQQEFTQSLHSIWKYVETNFQLLGEITLNFEDFENKKKLYFNAHVTVVASGTFKNRPDAVFAANKGLVMRARKTQNQGSLLTEGLLKNTSDHIDNTKGVFKGKKAEIETKILKNRNGKFHFSEDGLLIVYESFDNPNGLVQFEGRLEGREGDWSIRAGKIKGKCGIDLQIKSFEHVKNGVIDSAQGCVKIITLDDLRVEAKIEASTGITLVSNNGTLWGEKGLIITPQGKILLQSLKSYLYLPSLVVEGKEIILDAYQQIQLSHALLSSHGDITVKTVLGFIDAPHAGLASRGNVLFQALEGSLYFEDTLVESLGKVDVHTKLGSMHDSKFHAGLGFEYKGERLQTKNTIFLVKERDVLFNGSQAVYLTQSVQQSSNGKIIKISDWIYENQDYNQGENIIRSSSSSISLEKTQDIGDKIFNRGDESLSQIQYQAKGNEEIKLISQNSYSKDSQLEAPFIEIKAEEWNFNHSRARFKVLDLKIEEGIIYEDDLEGQTFSVRAQNNLTIHESILNIKESYLRTKKSTSLLRNQWKGSIDSQSGGDQQLIQNKFEEGNIKVESVFGNTTVHGNLFEKVGNVELLAKEGETSFEHNKAELNTLSLKGKKAKVRYSKIEANKVSTESETVQVDHVRAKSNIITLESGGKVSLEHSYLQAEQEFSLYTDGAAFVWECLVNGGNKVVVTSKEGLWEKSLVKGEDVEIKGNHSFNSSELQGEDRLNLEGEKVSLFDTKATVSKGDLSFKTNDLVLANTWTEGNQIALQVKNALTSFNHGARAKENISYTFSRGSLFRTQSIAPEVMWTGNQISGSQNSIIATRWDVNAGSAELPQTYARTQSSHIHTQSNLSLPFSALEGDIHMTTQTSTLGLYQSSVQGSLHALSGGDIVALFLKMMGRRLDLSSKHSLYGYGMHVRNSAQTYFSGTYVDTSYSTIQTHSLEQHALMGISSNNSHRFVQGNVVESAPHYLDLQGSYTQAGGRIFLDSNFIDHSRGTLDGNLECKAYFLNNRGAHMIVGNGNSLVSVTEMSSDAASRIEGPGSLEITHKNSYYGNGSVHLGGAFRVDSSNDIISNHTVDVGALQYTTKQKIVNNGNVTIAHYGELSGSAFYDLGPVHSMGTLSVHENNFQQHRNICALQMLHYNTNSSIVVTEPWNTLGGLSLHSRYGEIKTLAPLNVPGDLIMHGSNVSLHQRVNAKGRGIFESPGRLLFDHTSAFFGNGIDAHVGIFHSKVSDIDSVGRSRIKAQDFLLESEVKIWDHQRKWLWFTFDEQKRQHTPSNFRHEGDLELDIERDALNDASNFLIKGNLGVKAQRLRNENRTYIHTWEECIGKKKKKVCGVNVGKPTKKHATRQKIVNDGVANTQVSEVLGLDIGEWRNDGVFNASYIVGRVDNVQNGIFTHMARLPDSLPALTSLSGDGAFKVGGEVRATCKMQLKVEGKFHNRGFIGVGEGGEGLIVLKTKDFLNERPFSVESQEVVSGPVWNHKKRSVPVDCPQNGGKVFANILLLDTDKGENRGGTIEATEHLELTGGNFLNTALRWRSVVDLEPGPLGKGKGHDIKYNFLSGKILSGGTAKIDFRDDFVIQGSDVIGWDDTVVRAGTIVHEPLFSTYQDTDKQGLTYHKKSYTVVMQEGEMTSITGNLWVESIKGDIDVKGGKIGSYGGDVFVKSKRDILFETTFVDVENTSSSLKFVPIGVEAQTTTSNDPKVSLTHFFSGRNAQFLAEGKLDTEALDLQVGGDLDVEVEEIRLGVYKVPRYKNRSGISVGVSFFGSEAIKSCFEDNKGEQTMEALLRQDGAIGSVVDLAKRSRCGAESVMKGLKSAIEIWNESAKFAKAYKEGNLKNSIGEHLGITDGDGNFDPTFTVRLGFSEEESEWTQTLAPIFSVGNNLNIRAKKQTYNVPMEVGNNATFIGKEILWEAKVDTYLSSSSNSGFSVTIAPSGPSFGMDHSESESSSRTYNHANLNVGNLLKIESEKLTVRGVQLESEFAHVKIKEGHIQSLINTQDQKQSGVSFSTSGPINVAQGSSHNETIQTAGIKVRSHGEFQSDQLELTGSILKNLEVKTKQLIHRDLHIENRESSLSVGFNPLMMLSKQGISTFGSFDHYQSEQEEIVRATISGGNGKDFSGINTDINQFQQLGKKHSSYTGMLAVKINTQQVKNEFNDLKDVFAKKQEPNIHKQPIRGVSAGDEIEEIEEEEENERDEEPPVPLSLYEIMLRNQRKEEMLHTRMMAALLDPQWMVDGAKFVCSVHPKVYKTCRDVKNVGLEGVKLAVDGVKWITPTSWKPIIKQGLSEWLNYCDQTNYANAIEEKRLNFIPIEESLQHGKDLRMVGMNAALYPVGVVGGKAVSKSLSTVANKVVAPIGKAAKIAIHKVTSKIQQSNQVKKVAQEIIRISNRYYVPKTKVDVYSKIAHLFPAYFKEFPSAALHTFGKKYEESCFFPLIIKDSKEVLEAIAHGKSPSHVYFLQRPTHTSVVLKSFLSHKQVVMEFIAHQALQDLKSPHISFPKILAVGRQVGQMGRGNPMIAMNYVSGESVSVLMHNASKASLITPERSKILKKVNNAFDSVALFLADLHQKNTSITNKPSPKYIAIEIQEFEKRWMRVKDKGWGLGIDDIRVKKLIRQFRKNPGVSGELVYGDAHPSNFLWNGKKKISVIDLQSLAKSMEKGVPIGVGVKDIEQIFASVEGYGTILGLQKKEITLFKDTFSKRYLSAFKGSPATPEAQLFYRHFWAFDRLIQVSKDERLLEIFVNQFKKELGGTSVKRPKQVKKKAMGLEALTKTKIEQIAEPFTKNKIFSVQILENIKEISRKIPSKYEVMDEALIKPLQNITTHFNPKEYLPIENVSETVLQARNFIYKHPNKSKGYIKKTGDIEELLKEVKGMVLFENLGLTEIELSKILGFERSGYKATLFRSFLPGQTMDVIIREAIESNNIKKALRAVHLWGRGSGELHSKQYGSHPLPSRTINWFSNHLMACYEIVSDFAKSEKIPLPHKLKEIKKIIQAFKEDPGYASFTHEDPSLINVVYKKKIALIDLVIDAVNSKGVPEGSPFGSYYKMLEYLKEYLLEIKTPTYEREMFLKEFSSGYQATFIDYKGSSSQQFYRIFSQYESIADGIEFRLEDTLEDLELLKQMIKLIEK